jgi:hypothetical protein
MARFTKHCATCGSKEPVELRADPGDTHPNAVITYVAKCLTCGNDHPPDSTEIVADARAWEDEQRAKHDGAVIPPEE